MPVIFFGKETIPYDLSWSDRRKTLGISVQGTNVQVIAPTGTPNKRIKDILYKKAPWIRKQLGEYNEINTQSQERKFIAGEKLPYLGRSYRLKIQTNDSIEKSSLVFYRGTFIGKVPASLSESEYRSELYPLYKEWVMNRASHFLEDRKKRFAIKIGASPFSIQIKEQKKRWGSCTPEGNIYLNWRIFLAPTSVIDYVLVHELAHLKHLDHSSDFWQVIRSILPDYENRKEWLRVNGKQLYI